MDKIETRKNEKGTILTLEIGVLDERVNWLKDRLNLKENETKKIIQNQPTTYSWKKISSIRAKVGLLDN